METRYRTQNENDRQEKLLLSGKQTFPQEVPSLLVSEILRTARYMLTYIRNGRCDEEDFTRLISAILMGDELGRVDNK